MNAFLQTLGEIRQGGAVAELADQLSDLVKCVRETGRAGAITITLKVKPASKGDTATLMLEDAVTVKRPQPERGATIFYATTDHALSRQDPRQPELSGLRAPVAVTPCYEEDVQGTAQKGQLTIPSTITLGLAPFNGAESGIR